MESIAQMNNQLATANEWQTLTQMASVFIKSGLLPKSITTPEAALLIMWQGRELGIQPLQALGTINVISGKPTISPQLMLALIERSGQAEDIKVEVTDEVATVTMKRRGRTAHVEVFSYLDAKALGLANKDNWQKQRRTMMKWRAIAACARVVYPDIILGLYTPEEMGADVSVSDDGEMTVVSVTPDPVVQRQQQVAEPPPVPHILPPPPAKAPEADVVPTEPASEPPPQDAEPAPHKPWTEREKDAFLNRWQLMHDISVTDLKAALGVKEKWGEWQGTADEADAAVRAWRKAPVLADGAGR